MHSEKLEKKFLSSEKKKLKLWEALGEKLKEKRGACLMYRKFLLCFVDFISRGALREGCELEPLTLSEGGRY